LGEGSWKKERANTFFAINQVALVQSPPSGGMKCSNLLLLLCHGLIFGLGWYGSYFGVFCF